MRLSALALSAALALTLSSCSNFEQGGDKINPIDGDQINPIGDGTLTVTFDSKGAENPATPASIKVQSGLSANASGAEWPSDPLKQGWDFRGWSETASAKFFVDSDTDISKSLTLNAQYGRYWTQLVIASSAPSYRLAARFNGNFYLTVDGGAHWTGASPGYGMWFAPWISADGHYMTILEFGYGSEMLWYSDDYGATWQYSTGLPSSDLSTVAAQSNGTLWIIAENDLYTSTNHGSSWAAASGTATLDPYDYAADTGYAGRQLLVNADGTKFVATTSDNDGGGYILYSGDGGASWDYVMLGIDPLFDYLNGIAGSNDLHYLSIDVPLKGIYSSTDYGATWTLSGYVDLSQPYVWPASSSDGSIMVTGQNNGSNGTVILKSGDHGATWTTVMTVAAISGVAVNVSDPGTFANPKFYYTVFDGDIWYYNGSSASAVTTVYSGTTGPD
jgi:hypothetical protein